MSRWLNGIGPASAGFRYYDIALESPLSLGA